MTEAAVSVKTVGECGVDKHRVMEYIQRRWERPTLLSNEMFYNWLFMKDQAEPKNDHNVIVIDKEHSIKGFVGITPQNFSLRGRIIRGAQMTSFMLDPDIAGIGLVAIPEFLLRDYDVCVGANIDEKLQVPELAAFTGHKYVRYMPRYIRIVNIDAVKSITSVSMLAERIARYNSRKHAGGWRCREAHASDIEEAAQVMEEKYNCFARDADFIQWRYSHHPCFDYEFYCITANTQKVIIVLRIDDCDSMRICHVVEFFGHEEAFDSGVRFLDDYFEKHEVDIADFYCLSQRIGSVFWCHNWLSAVDDYFIQIPHLFHPLTSSEVPTASVIIRAPNYEYEIMDLTSFYFTKADCDLDKPTPQYIEKKAITLGPRKVGT